MMQNFPSPKAEASHSSFSQADESNGLLDPSRRLFMQKTATAVFSLLLPACGSNSLEDDIIDALLSDADAAIDEIRSSAAEPFDTRRFEKAKSELRILHERVSEMIKKGKFVEAFLYGEYQQLHPNDRAKYTRSLTNYQAFRKKLPLEVILEFLINKKDGRQMAMQLVCGSLRAEGLELANEVGTFHDAFAGNGSGQYQGDCDIHSIVWLECYSDIARQAGEVWDQDDLMIALISEHTFVSDCLQKGGIRKFANANVSTASLFWLTEKKYRQLQGVDDKMIVLLKPQEIAHELYLNVGASHSIAGRNEQALACYNMCLEMFPDKVTAMLYANRAITFSKLGKDQEAIDDLTSALNLNPEYYRAYALRSHLYAKRGEYREAIRDYKQVIKGDPSKTGMWLYIAACYKRLGEKQKAREYIQKFGTSSNQKKTVPSPPAPR